MAFLKYISKLKEVYEQNWGYGEFRDTFELEFHEQIMFVLDGIKETSGIVASFTGHLLLCKGHLLFRSQTLGKIISIPRSAIHTIIRAKPKLLGQDESLVIHYIDVEHQQQEQAEFRFLNTQQRNLVQRILAAWQLLSNVLTDDTDGRTPASSETVDLVYREFGRNCRRIIALSGCEFVRHPEHAQTFEHVQAELVHTLIADIQEHEALSTGTVNAPTSVWQDIHDIFVVRTNDDIDPELNFSDGELYNSHRDMDFSIKILSRNVKDFVKEARFVANIYHVYRYIIDWHNPLLSLTVMMLLLLLAHYNALHIIPALLLAAQAGVLWMQKRDPTFIDVLHVVCLLVCVFAFVFVFVHCALYIVLYC
jgi:hypothetical protein